MEKQILLQNSTAPEDETVAQHSVTNGTCAIGTDMCRVQNYTKKIVANCSALVLHQFTFVTMHGSNHKGKAVTWKAM